MADHVLALDQGTTSTRAIVFDASGGDRRGRAARARADLPARRLGRARPDRDLDEHAVGDRRRPRRRGALAAGFRRRRHHQPARDGDRVGPPHRPPGRTTRSCGRTPARSPSSTSSPPTAAPTGSPATTGLPLATYFSASKIAWILENIPGRASGCRGRASAVRHPRHLAHLEPHGRHAAAASMSPMSRTRAARC